MLTQMKFKMSSFRFPNLWKSTFTIQQPRRQRMQLS